MSVHNVPNDVLGNLHPFALIILIPVCDLFVRRSILPIYTFLTPRLTDLSRHPPHGFQPHRSQEDSLWLLRGLSRHDLGCVY